VGINNVMIFGGLYFLPHKNSYYMAFH